MAWRFIIPTVSFASIFVKAPSTPVAARVAVMGRRSLSKFNSIILYFQHGIQIIWYGAVSKLSIGIDAV
jgi:hypothetical protein